jgi:hypothetical protein
MVTCAGNFILNWPERPKCGPNSEAVIYAKSLSQERLESLYYQMESHTSDVKQGSDGYQVYISDVEIPDAFKDLKVLKIRPRDKNIMVQGCMDEFVYLYFEKEDIDNIIYKRIRLAYPDHKGPYSIADEIIWQG